MVTDGRARTLQKPKTIPCKDCGNQMHVYHRCGGYCGSTRRGNKPPLLKPVEVK